MLSMLQPPFGTFQYLNPPNPELEPVFHMLRAEVLVTSCTVREMLQPECTLRTQEGCVEREI
jgi:hypothetical protein